MEGLIAALPVLAPFINFVLIPMFNALRKESLQLREENAELRGKIQELEVAMYRDFCRRANCANFTPRQGG